jgi:tryptophan synthase alpha chain
MNRIDQRFAELRAASRAGLIPFVTAGDPDPASTVAVMHALVKAGADIVELGVPFSDPMADGPVIQRASERALARGVGLNSVLEMVAAFRRDDARTPVVLMGYLNPIERIGIEAFARKAAAAGVDGALIVDCPVEEAHEFSPALEAAGLHQIFLAAPTTTDERLAKMAQSARGFLYYVSFAGITGADRLATASVRERVVKIKGQSSIPVAVGFGVKSPEQAVELAAHADAIVIGSALVERLAEAKDAAAAARIATEFLAPIRAALDRATMQSALATHS